MTISTWRSCITATAATALAVGAFMGGCGSTATSSGSSDMGESCSSEFDCKSGLFCVANVCSTTPGGNVTSDGGGPTEDGPSGTNPDTGPGKEGGGPKDGAPPQDGKGPEAGPVEAGGEASPGSEGGSDVTQPTMPGGPSAQGQECSATTDCASGLVCVPVPGGRGGVCDIATYGLQPTGEVCGGECAASSDCYELPADIGKAAGVAAQLTGPVVQTCADVATYFGTTGAAGYATACTGTLAPVDPIATACFLWTTYCLPSSASWTCEPNTSVAGNGNRCVFTGACKQNVVNDFQGCPSETRLGAAVALAAPNTTNCDQPDAGVSGKCQATPGTITASGCTTDATCSSMMLSTADTHVVCNANECACVVSAGVGSCYKKCAVNDDCPAGRDCNATNHLCEAPLGCAANLDCVTKFNNPQAVCNTMTGECSVPCASDHDCSISSGSLSVSTTLGTFNGTVCDTATKTCQSVLGACSSNAQCVVQDGGAGVTVNTFCVKPAVGVSGTVTAVSAITN